MTAGRATEWAGTERRGMCGICPAGCWVKVRYDDDGRIAEVKADDSSHLGMICKLGEHSPDIIYSKDRLKYPMRRRGVKGNYDFERISWDDAYEIIVDRLNLTKEEHGPEASCIYTGRGSFELSLCDIFQPKGVATSSASSVLFPYGSPNTMGVGALCYVAFAMIAPHVTMGGMLINMYSDIENAEMIVVWGANPATDCPPLDLGRINQAHQRGAKIVVIDPRQTKTARLTEAEWIKIRPGTDGALALGLSQVIIAEELFDESFVENWTVGFDDFARYVQHYRPETVAEITGVPAETIISLARRLAAANGAASVMYSGLEYADGGVQAIRATHVLWALAGQLDVPGGRCFTMRQNHFKINRSGHLENPDLTKALARDRFPVYSSYRGESHAVSLPDSVLNSQPYKIRNLIIHGGSIITSWPESPTWRKTLAALEFLVCIDRQLTADSAYADIVLPATTMYEIASYMTFGPIFRIREKLIEPVGEARNDFQIMAELAKHLGYGHLYPQSEKELLDHILKGSGFNTEQVIKAGGTVQTETAMMEYKKWEKGGLRPNGNPGFDTPSGKFEIASSILEENGYPALPEYTEPAESPRSNPELAKKYPLVFNSGARVTTDFRTQHHGIEALHKLRPEPTVTINTNDAKRRNISNGEQVIIKTLRGEINMRALVSDRITEGAIDANMGGGGPVGPKAWQDCNVNELTDLNRLDPISGFPVYKALLCEVAPVSNAGNRVEIDSGEGDYLSKIDQTREQTGSLSKRIYLDHNATTYLDDEVAQLMKNNLKTAFGNPSAIYSEGRQAKDLLESARRSVARLLNCTARRVVFTGSGSEANNMAIKGCFFARPKQKNHIITTNIEHPAILQVCRWLEQNGGEVTYLPVDRQGLVSVAECQAAIRPETLMITIMMANNETGTIQPIAQLGKLAREQGVIFHTDATQAVGKLPINIEALNCDMLTFSAHKIYGPKGVGALYLRKGTKLDPLIHGGHQERGVRAGTENLINIIGLGKASDLAVKNLSEMNRVRELRDQLQAGILKLIPEAKLNGHQTERLANTLNLHLPGVRGESLTLALDQQGVSTSPGSACRSGSPDPSHALLALGLTDEEAHCSIRLSLGIGNSAEEIKQVITLIGTIVADKRSMVRFVPCR